ncbi:MAG: helix-turn-helix transcriptional regulator [Xanthobacteraceae bacterium]
MPGRRADGNDAIVGRNIRVHRLARKMSQTGLADAIGLTFQQVQKYEKGVNRVGSGRLVRIANALGVPVMTLLAGVPGAAAKTADASPLTLIAKAQPMRLMQAFAAIEDQSARRALLALTEGLARFAEGRR